SSPDPAAPAAGASAAKTPAPIIEPSPITTASAKPSRRCSSPGTSSDAGRSLMTAPLTCPHPRTYGDGASTSDICANFETSRIPRPLSGPLTGRARPSGRLPIAHVDLERMLVFRRLGILLAVVAGAALTVGLAPAASADDGGTTYSWVGNT